MTSSKANKSAVSKPHEIVFNLRLTNYPVKGGSTRKMRPNAMRPGDRSDITSFVICYDSEPKVAAYLGYDDLGEFWKCQMSFHVIDYFNVYAKHCSGQSAKVALELIRDMPNIASTLPQHLSQAVKLYTAAPTATAPKQQKSDTETNIRYLMATLLYRLAEKFENANLLQCRGARPMTRSRCQGLSSSK